MRSLSLAASLSSLVLLAACSSAGRDEANPFPVDPSGSSGNGSGADGVGHPLDDDPSLSTPDEQAELAALEIGNDEVMVDGDGVDLTSSEFLPDNPLDTDPDGSTEDPADLGADDFDLGAASLHVTDLENPIAVAKPGQGWKCVDRNDARKTKDDHGCICKGSPLNCKVPNTQPGKNRFLRASYDADLVKAGDAAGDGRFIEFSKWDVKPDATLYDGHGIARGPFTSPCFTTNPVKDAAHPYVGAPGTCVKLNFGQIKNVQAPGVAAQPFYYAFNVYVRGPQPVDDLNPSPAEGINSSGWIPESAIAPAVLAELKKMPKVAPRHSTVIKLAKTSYVVKNRGDYTLGAAETKFKDGHVGDQSGGARQVADYLLKNDYINLAFGTPGVGGPATDTLWVSPDHDGTISFKRAVSTAKYPTLVYTHAQFANPDDARRKRLVFAFGQIGTRMGWLALPAFAKGRQDTAHQNPCHGIPDGTSCSFTLGYSGRTCMGGKVTAQPVCPLATPYCQGGKPDGTLACVALP